ncbi:Bifunctional epoxide hydrolase [Lachnellula suecica]|uniref:Bifunctional epoxide hydrolase n=1 Tax=Lachnellula suecica TaxID=602035 RepID=A0A8T9CB91_9HELO|nr:Bifunctional epoxide hydrolase [Lachnellula suecica]
MALSCYPDISKLIKLEDGTRYAYAFSPAAASKPTFLLLHGFPSSSYDWRHQISALKLKGYGVVAPDLLGYGDTDSPASFEAYSLKTMSDHIASILASEGLGKVIGVSHDWGSGLLSHFYTWHPECLSSLIFASVGYIEPSGTARDIDAINTLTEKLFGYANYGYWKFFNTEGAAKILDSNPHSMTSLLFPHNPEMWRVNFAPVGAAEAWISAGTTTPPPSWLTAEELIIHDEIMAKKGYTGPLNWYEASMRGVDASKEATISKEGKEVQLPTLLVVSD